MAGFTLTEEQTHRLGQIVDDCRLVGDEPIPWRVLEGLSRLLQADEVSLGGYCFSPAHVWFMNGVDTSGRFTDGETPEEATCDPFRRRFWTSSCSYPARTGDVGSVTFRSDLHSVREPRRTAPGRLELQREIMACIRISALRELRILGWRHDGADFTDRDRFFLRLLRPHIGDHYRRWVDEHPPAAGLTERQLSVLALVRDGYTNEQIGRRLQLSEGTVRTHLTHVFGRLGVTSRTAAVTAVYGDAVHG